MPATALQTGITSLLNRRLFTISNTPVSITTLVMFVLIVLATYTLSYLVRRGLERAFHMRGVKDVGTIGIAKRLTHYVLMAIGIVVALQTIGVNLSAVLAAGAVFGVAIGFAMQNVAQNFVSGLILLIERTIKPGDVIEVDGRIVRVERMQIRSTTARTRDEEELIVPNGKLVQSTVTNFTLRDSLYRVRASVGVAYESDLRLVRETLERAAAQVAGRDPQHEPRVLLTSFGDSTVNYDVSIWINDPWSAPARVSDLNEAIWWAFKDNAITIAFPQVDVHFDGPADLPPDALRPAG